MPLTFQQWGRRFLVFGSITIGVILLLFTIESYYPPEKKLNKITLTPQPTTPQAPGPTFALPSFAEPLKNTSNTTRQLAAQIAQELIRLNPNGPKTPTGANGIAAPDAATLVNDFLAEGAKKFDYSKLKPTIDDRDIQIIESNDSTAFAAYLKSFFAILSRVPASLDRPDAGSIDILASVYDGYIRDYAALDVPRPLLSIHKKNLATLVATKRMLSMIRDYQSDPLQAVLAFQALEHVRTESQAVYTEVVLFIADHELKITL